MQINLSQKWGNLQKLSHQMKFVDLYVGRIAQAKSHSLNVDMSRITEIKGIRFPIDLIFSLKLNGVYMPLTFLLTWKFALKAKALHVQEES